MPYLIPFAVFVEDLSSLNLPEYRVSYIIVTAALPEKAQTVVCETNHGSLDKAGAKLSEQFCLLSIASVL